MMEVIFASRGKKRCLKLVKMPKQNFNKIPRMTLLLLFEFAVILCVF